MIKTQENKISQLEKSINLEDIPVPQRLLKSGFKKITNDEIKKRFAIDKINERLKKERNEKAWEKIKHHLNNPKVNKINIYSVYTIFEKTIISYYINYKRFLLPDYWKLQSEKVPSFELPYLNCSIKFEDFDKYNNDIIPDRIIEKVSLIKRLGADTNSLRVAYPTIGTDPILVYFIDDYTMLEIDYWE